MNTVFKRLLIGLVALAVLAGAALWLGVWLGERKSQRQVLVLVSAVTIPGDATSLARGRYLYASRGCAECHGADGAGREFINDGKGMLVKAPNISPGSGSVVGSYAPEDWVRTIRHGIKPNNRPVYIMPSEDFNRLTDADLGALIAHVKQLPPVSGTGMVAQVPAMVKALYAAGLITDAAEKIDHTLPPAAPIPEGPTAEHGAYVVNTCLGCHGAHLSGGKIPGTPPDWPPAANLTAGEGSAMVRYPSVEAFAAMLRSGKRPDGTAVSTVMPFTTLREINELDVRALYLFLKGVPALAAGQR